MRFLRSVLLVVLAVAGVTLALAYLVPPRIRPMHEPVDNAPLHTPSAPTAPTPHQAG